MIDTLTFKLINEITNSTTEQTVTGKKGMEVEVEIDDLTGTVKMERNENSTSVTFNGEYRIKPVDWLDSIGSSVKYDDSSNKWTFGGGATLVFGKNWKLKGNIVSDGDSTKVSTSFIFLFD